MSYWLVSLSEYTTRMFKFWYHACQEMIQELKQSYLSPQYYHLMKRLPLIQKKNNTTEREITYI